MKNKNKVIRDKAFNTPSQPIPIFGYKSSFIIVIGFMAVLFVVPPLFRVFWPAGYVLGLIVSAILMALIVCYAQFFIQSNKGITKNFKIVWFCLSVLFSVILIITYTQGLVM